MYMTFKIEFKPSACLKSYASSGMNFKRTLRTSLRTWEGTMTLQMWPWHVRMVSRWRLTRSSWQLQVHSSKKSWRETSTPILWFTWGVWNQKTCWPSLIWNQWFPVLWRGKCFPRKLGLFPCTGWWTSFERIHWIWQSWQIQGTP